MRNRDSRRLAGKTKVVCEVQKCAKKNDRQRGVGLARICFITLGDIDTVPTLKRATGMAPELACLGHEVSIVAWDVPANRKRLAFEAPHAEPLWISNHTLLGEVVQKISVVRKWKPDLIYSTAFSPRNLAFLKKCYARNAVLITEHCELFSSFRGPVERLVHQSLETRSLVEADGVVCASDYLLEAFTKLKQSRSGSAELNCLPYGYPDYLIPDAPRRSGASVKNVTFMATLWKNYGVLDVIHAASVLYKKRTDFVINIFGDGPARFEAAQLINEKGLSDCVFLRGFVEEEALKEQFSLTDVFLAPLYNTVQDIARCPSKVYYYLPFQKPIVTCAFGDPYKLLKDDGYYYVTGDVNSMAFCMSKAMDESDQFVFKYVNVADHSWRSRACQFEAWCRSHNWLS